MNHTSVQNVLEQLGHASIKITIDIYGHPRQGTNIVLADRLGHLGGDTAPYATVVQLTTLNPDVYPVISKE